MTFPLPKVSKDTFRVVSRPAEVLCDSSRVRQGNAMEVRIHQFAIEGLLQVLIRSAPY